MLNQQTCGQNNHSLKLFKLSTLLVICFVALAIAAIVPLYPSSTGVTYQKFGETDTLINIRIEYVANDNREKLIDWYSDQLTRLGWEVYLVELNDDSEPGGRSKQIEGNKGEAEVHVFFEKSTATATPVRLTFNGAKSGP